MSGDALWKSLKFAVDFTDETGKESGQPILSQYYDPDKVLYGGHQGPYWNDQELIAKVKQSNLRPDVTFLPAGTIGDEFIRTEGHHHISNFPEVYETIYGQNIYLLFKPKVNNPESDEAPLNPDYHEIEDVMAVFAEPGDHVIFLPGYPHISINIGNTPFVMTDWVSTNANSSFKYIKRHNGAPYWVVKGRDGRPEFIPNPRYKGAVPTIRLVRPAPEIPEFGLKIGCPKKAKFACSIFSMIPTKTASMMIFMKEHSCLTPARR
jgi:oxalate decarboxylase/phosphoglucose isomerase-like protein (cupin superfamily)